MKRTIYWIAVVMSVAGGCLGLISFFPRLFSVGDNGAAFILLLLINGVFVFGISAAIRLIKSGWTKVDWITAFVALQVPIVTSPFVSYRLICVPGIFAGYWKPNLLFWGQMRGQVAIFLGRPDPYGFAINLLALGVSVALIYFQKQDRKRPNQALQTTPMTPSVDEKTIEFGYPQRGV